MPIYEFYCQDCNTIYNFFSKSVNTKKSPNCPMCKTSRLSRQVSVFSVTGRAKAGNDADDPPFDESKMEKAIQMLGKEAESINEEDPRQAADLMRKLSDAAGLKLGSGMDEAIRRLEKGEDPDRIESEMSDILEQEEPFSLSGKKGVGRSKRTAPLRDETLYDL
ncbi:MAG: zinc ribbon domain-containing protein, partial [Desulfobacterales bacterium]|nr:zinc ribbon domain-containing protein [Desulfobacterales bacterium]